jgi:hypothetical protein
MTKQQDLELIVNSIRNRRSIAFMKGLFRTVNQIYRECIDRVQETDQVSDSDLSSDEYVIPKKAVPTISLSQLVEQVLVAMQEEIKSCPSRSSQTISPPDLSYLLTVSVAYANCLLSYLIFPHRRLQTFLLSLCEEAQDFTTLQYLLNFRVIMDSPEVLDTLSRLCETSGDTHAWLHLARMDMAKRIGRTDIVLDCLLKQERALDLVEYIRANDPSFEIEKLFALLSKYNIRRTDIWDQIEAWNTSPGLGEGERPVLSHRVIMLNAS